MWLRRGAAVALAELDIQTILRKLVEGEVEFLLIGGIVLKLKELAGRPEDLADLQRLREAREA
jgi:hypothetical protein